MKRDLPLRHVGAHVEFLADPLLFAEAVPEGVTPAGLRSWCKSFLSIDEAKEWVAFVRREYGFFIVRADVTV